MKKEIMYHQNEKIIVTICINRDKHKELKEEAMSLNRSLGRYLEGLIDQARSNKSNEITKDE